MTWSLIAHTSAAGNNSTATTTPSVDTTGADLIVIIGTYYGPGGGAISDSKSSTWPATVLTAQSSNSFNKTVLSFVQAPAVGSGHTFTISTPGTQVASLLVEAWSGSVASPLDQTNNTQTDNVASIQPGSITPGSGNELIITGTGWGMAAPTTVSVDSGFTQPDAFVAWTNNVNYGASMSYLVQGAAAAVNPTWSYSPSVDSGVVIASFTGAAAATSVPERGKMGVGSWLAPGVGDAALTAAGLRWAAEKLKNNGVISRRGLFIPSRRR